MSTPVAIPPFNELQKQMFVTLGNGLSANVYDNVPESVSKPWVTIGEAIAIPDYFHGGFGWDVLLSVHVWTKSLGFKSALDIGNQIIALLDHQRDALAMPDPWSIVSLRFVQLSTMRDPDPEIRHVPVQFRIVIHQEV